MSDKIKQGLGLYDEVTSIIGEERPTEPAFANEDPEGWWNVLEWEEKVSQALADLLMVERRKNQKLQAENAELKKKSQWISVEDELPEINQRVLTFRPDILDVDRFRFCRFGRKGFASVYKVTHWMPLPTPPEVE